MADGDVITIGRAKFQEVSMIPFGTLLRNTPVVMSDIRYSNRLSSYLYLECIKPGTTAMAEPDFSGVSHGDIIVDGTATFKVKDKRKADFAENAAQLQEMQVIDGVAFDGTSNVIHYGLCSTDADVAEKVVKCRNFVLGTGSKISVKFTENNTADSPMLNVEDTGAKDIVYMGSAIAANCLRADKIYTFIYNGESYDIDGGVGESKREPILTVFNQDDANITLESINDKAVYVFRYNGKGTLEATSSDPNVVTVSVIDKTVTFTGVGKGKATVEIKVPDTDEFYEDHMTISVTCKGVAPIGITMDSSGENAFIGRVDENGSTQTGIDFNDTYPWSDIESVTVDGEAMVKIPKFYIKTGTYKEGMNAGKKYWLISKYKKQGFHVHPAFMLEGNEIPYFYIGAYEMYNNSNKGGSASGKQPWVSIGGFEKAKFYAAAKDSKAGWHLQTIYERHAISLLFMMEYGHPNAQTAISPGNSDSAGAALTGNTNAVYRGMHELWGNVWEHVDGIKGSGKKLTIWDTNGNHSYVDTGITIPENLGGYIANTYDTKGSNFDLGDVFIPSEVTANEASAVYPDGVWGAKDNFVAIAGGAYDTGTKSGLFAIAFNGIPTASGAATGARIAKYPSIEKKNESEMPITKYGGFGDSRLGNVVLNDSSVQLNSYAKVTAVSGDCMTLSLANISKGAYGGFNVGEKVMFHIVKTVSKETAMWGQYVIANIVSTDGDNVMLDKPVPAMCYPLTDTVKYYAQLVTIPQFTNMDVYVPIYALAWDNSLGRGGILALEASGTINMFLKDGKSGQFLAEGKGLPSDTLPDSISKLDNSALENILPMTEGGGIVFVVAKEINLQDAARFGSSRSGAIGHGKGGAGNKTTKDSHSINYGWRRWINPGDDGEDENKGAGGNGGAAGANNDGYRSPGGVGGKKGKNAEGYGGSSVLLIAETTSGFKLDVFSTGGVGGSAGWSSNGSHGAAGTDGGAGCGGGGGGGAAVHSYYNKTSTDYGNGTGGGGGSGAGFGMIITTEASDVPEPPYEEAYALLKDKL